MATNTTIDNAVEKYRSMLSENRVYTAKLFKHFLLKKYGKDIVNELYEVEQEVKKNKLSDMYASKSGRLFYKESPEATITGVGEFFRNPVFSSSESFTLTNN